LVHEVQFDSQELTEFFNWFKDYKLQHDNVQRYRELYYSLPFTIAKMLNEFYQKMGIHIHDPSPVPLDQQDYVLPIIEEANTIDPIIQQLET
jgi:hypothetical protein